MIIFALDTATKIENVAQSFALATLTDVYVGTAVAGSTAVEALCFSLQTNTGLRLDLEAKSFAHVQVWLDQISRVLANLGAVIDDPDGPPQAVPLVTTVVAPHYMCTYDAQTSACVTYNLINGTKLCDWKYNGGAKDLVMKAANIEIDEVYAVGHYHSDMID